ncbi:hypothetical protein Q8A67_022800 [Cirrhinus molitorella]|uniref:Uncharacterized protein n=1 Tax=Cirrhinus molitorella TaxID=172907 RepID=A0AA88PGB7_9TELE|nr:hypothetical protein Q8A67_022800 [Cirrhinus molitorella]
MSGERHKCLHCLSACGEEGVQFVRERDSQARVLLGSAQQRRTAYSVLGPGRSILHRAEGIEYQAENLPCYIHISGLKTVSLQLLLADINLECLQRLGRLTCRSRAQASRATFDEILGGPHCQLVNSRRLECSGHDLSRASSAEKQEATFNKSKTQNLFCTGSGDKDSERVEKGYRGVGQGAAGACGGSAHPLLESGSPLRPCRPLPNPVSPSSAMVT